MGAVSKERFVYRATHRLPWVPLLTREKLDAAQRAKQRG
jgi:hypothetical protein